MMLTSTRGGEKASSVDWSPGKIVCLDSSSAVCQILDEFIGTDRYPGKLIVASGNGSPIALAQLCARVAPAILAGEESDLAGPAVSGLKSLIERQAIQLIVFSDSSDDATYERFFQLGCVGVLPFTVSHDTLHRALDAITNGELWMPRRILSKLARMRPFALGDGGLTPRESDVLRLIRLGRTNQQIAEELFISRETVRWHVRRLYSKVGRESRDGTALARVEALASV